MFWLLIKILVFVLGVIVLMYGVMEFSQIFGEVLLIFGGLEMWFGLLEVVFVLVGFVVLVWIGFKLFGLFIVFFKFLNGDEMVVLCYFICNWIECGY